MVGKKHRCLVHGHNEPGVAVRLCGLHPRNILHEVQGWFHSHTKPKALSYQPSPHYHPLCIDTLFLEVMTYLTSFHVAILGDTQCSCSLNSNVNCNRMSMCFLRSPLRPDSRRCQDQDFFKLVGPLSGCCACCAFSASLLLCFFNAAFHWWYRDSSIPSNQHASLCDLLWLVLWSSILSTYYPLFVLME